MFTFHFPAQMRGQAILNDFQRSFHPVHDWDPFNLVLQRIFPFSHFCVALSSGGGGTTKLLAQSNPHPAPSGSSSVVAALYLLFRPRQALNEVHVPSWRELVTSELSLYWVDTRDPEPSSDGIWENTPIQYETWENLWVSSQLRERGVIKVLLWYFKYRRQLKWRNHKITEGLNVSN